MAKLKPIGSRFSEAADKKINIAAAKLGLSKSEFIRQLVLTKIGMKAEIDLPKTEAGYRSKESNNTAATEAI